MPCFCTPKVYAFQFLIRSCTLAAHRYIQLSDTWFGLKCIDILFETVDKIGNIRQKSLFLASIEKVEDLTTRGLFPHRNNCLMLKRGSSRWNMPLQLCPSPPLSPLLLKQPDLLVCTTCRGPDRLLSLWPFGLEVLGAGSGQETLVCRTPWERVGRSGWACECSRQWITHILVKLKPSWGTF